MSQHTEFCQPFKRLLPGGGYVAIDVTMTAHRWRPSMYTGKVVVERRADWRRQGHEPPVIATASDTSVEGVVRKLLPVAQSNSAVGAALLRLSPV